ncbi:hypothetical protein BDN72DRAFT_850056 [Pluteus cervinus]|uniref:Uncharacterized protein n=1 Tax=Pluteus cervinus TaxID=181527 RepID=A0ACD3A531_9AGAR|nr:hypothetical protein BDN72DRAFT_850056 [Pluteus cervinus]
MEVQTVSLCSLSDWSIQHIQDVFEARTDEQALRAIAATFSEKIHITMNGARIPREGLIHSVLSLRKGSSGLRVHWRHAVDAPSDPSTNRDGTFGGVYAIRGIQRVLPGSSKPIEFERIKAVTVKIQSEALNKDTDTRRIVELVFVASDVRVDRQAAM